MCVCARAQAAGSAQTSRLCECSPFLLPPHSPSSSPPPPSQRAELTEPALFLKEAQAGGIDAAGLLVAAIQRHLSERSV